MFRTEGHNNGGFSFEHIIDVIVQGSESSKMQKHVMQQKCSVYICSYILLAHHYPMLCQKH